MTSNLDTQRSFSITLLSLITTDKIVKKSRTGESHIYAPHSQARKYLKKQLRFVHFYHLLKKEIFK